MNLTPTEMHRRLLVVAAFNQSRAATYAMFADLYRTRYLSRHRGWRRWFVAFDQGWVREKIHHFQVLAEAHAFAARVLMGIDE